MPIWVKRKVVVLGFCTFSAFYMCFLFYTPLAIFTRNIPEENTYPLKEDDDTVEKEIAFQIEAIFKKLKKSNEIPDSQENPKNVKLDGEGVKASEGIEDKPVAKAKEAKVMAPVLESLLKNIVIQYPTSGAPYFTSDLPKPWNISPIILLPWKVTENVGETSADNNGCFRPPEPRQQWAMITMIKSWTVNGNNRQAIRETWGSITRIGGVTLEIFFLVARPKNAGVQDELTKENEKYGDILQIDIEETTEHFTARSVAGMDWVVRNIPSNFLFSTCDDNMVLNLDNFIMSITETVQRQKPASSTCEIADVFPFICVFSFRRSDPPSRDTNNPWSVHSQLYPPNVLPAHCQGGFYTTSVSTIRLVIEKATLTKVMSLDAVWISGIMRQKAGMDANSVIAAPAIDYPGELVRYVEQDIPNAMRKYWTKYSENLSKHNAFVRLR